MDRDAIVLPGGRNGPHAPLLMYAADAAQARGARIRHVHWDPPTTRSDSRRRRPDPGWPTRSPPCRGGRC
jgi:hypothetical protein